MKDKVKVIVVIFIGVFCCMLCNQYVEYCARKKNVKELGLDKGYDNISVVKSFEGRLGKEKEKRIISTIIKEMGCKIVSNQEKNGQRRIYAYSPVLNNDIIYNDKKTNLNIIITYMEDLNVSSVYIGCPIVNIDY